MQRRRYGKCTLAAVLSVSLFVSSGNIYGAAAKKAKTALSTKKLTVQVGSKKTVKLKGTAKKATWRVISGKKKISVKIRKKYTAVITGRQKGTAKLQAAVGKKKYICTIKVKDKSTPAASAAPTANTSSPGAVTTTNVPAVSSPVPTGTQEPTPSPVPTPTPTVNPFDEDGKYTADVTAVRKLVQQLNKEGAGISEDLGDTSSYQWSNSGRLIGIYWAGASIKGEVSFAGLPELLDIDCSTNEITDLDISGNTKLIDLRCYNNKLEELELSNNKWLTELDCHGNQLAALKVVGENLQFLYCQENAIPSLNLTKCTNVQRVDCNTNRIKKLNITGCSSLEVLDVHGNRISDMGFLYGDNDVLKELNCADNNLGTWDYEIASLENLDCSANVIDLFRSNGLDNLKSLDCSNNALEKISLSAMRQLETVNLDGNALETIQISDNLKLKSLNISNNQIGTLTISHVGLEELICEYNEITGLDISGAEGLKMLDCEGNELVTIDVRYNQSLKVLNCSANPIETLAIQHDTLEELYCAENDLSVLDISQAPSLKILDCGASSLTSLDIHANTALEQLICPSALRDVLDTSNNPLLKKISYKDD